MKRDGRIVADRVLRASTLGDRLRGLLGRREMETGSALLLQPARQIHTIGMRFPIDVVFCDRDLRVLRVVRSLRPRRVTRYVRRAHYVVECAGGSVGELAPGDELSISR